MLGVQSSSGAGVLLLLIFAGVSNCGTAAEPVAGWTRHTIDASSRGADGVRLADVNGDGRMDLTTGWEEGGVVRVYVNPGPADVKQAWPAVTVGRVRSPEDAVFADLDGDGAVDVISSCEGKVRSMFVHWAPRERTQFLNAKAWTSSVIDASADANLWMFCLPLQVDGQGGIDLVAGSKGGGAEVGWFQSPENPRDTAAWKWHPLRKSGWIMSLLADDVDHDGDPDIVISDRKGAGRGVYWLENPGPGALQFQRWTAHAIGGTNQEVMFLAPGDLDGDDRRDFIVAVKGGDLLWLKRTDGDKPAWTPSTIALPPGTGSGKAAYAADVNLDGRQDVLFSCEHSERKSGLMWLEFDAENGPGHPQWKAHEISGKEHGVKFDLLQLLDLDEDGDLDVITCEERDNLGVIWYENPARSLHIPNH